MRKTSLSIMNLITTPRLQLVPTTLPLIEAELRSQSDFASMLGARIPDGWPPGEYDRHAMEYFRVRLRENPDGAGWYGWYALTRSTEPDLQVLIGAGGFFGPPSVDGHIELGYSIVSAFEGQGYATELVRGLMAHAFSTGQVNRILARTTTENIGSVKVLEKAGFRLVGPGKGPGSVEYSQERSGLPVKHEENRVMTPRSDLLTSKTATVLGATGLIGGRLLELLERDPDFTAIKVLSRRTVPFDHPKVQVLVIDFADDAAFRAAIAGSDVLFSAIGTTQKNVEGDKAAYRKVDYDIPVHAAQYCAETKCPAFLIVSSVGANSKSKTFYLKLKGEVEDKIETTGIRSISIFRPSMLLGHREEYRPGEGFIQALMRSLSFLFPSNYKPIDAREVARAMVAASKKNTPGVHIYHYKEMMEL